MGELGFYSSVLTTNAPRFMGVEWSVESGQRTAFSSFQHATHVAKVREDVPWHDGHGIDIACFVYMVHISATTFCSLSNTRQPLLVYPNVLVFFVVPWSRTLRSDVQPARWKLRMNARTIYSASW